MKKRILIALVVVLALAAAASLVWATPVSLTVVSDTGVMVYGPLTSYAGLGDAAWGMSKPAVPTWVHPSWPWQPGDPEADGAIWISTANYVEEHVNDSWRWFHDEMTLACTAYNITGSVVQATSDNAEEFYFNGGFVASDGEVQGPYTDNGEWGTVINYPITPQPGINALDFIVRNYACYYPTIDGLYSCTSPNPAEDNPTGLIYKATVNYQVPDVVWQPPVTNADFELKDGTTLPLKFKLHMQDGTLITDMKDVYMTVHGPSDGGLGPFIVRWDLGDGIDSLRWNDDEDYYIANFQTRDYPLDDGGTYTAVVHDGCTDEVLEDTISFVLNVKAGRGNSGK